MEAGTSTLATTTPTVAVTEISAASAAAIGEALRHLLADVFTLYLKTKNFHWHMSGVHFRDYHLLLDEHSDQLLAMTDPIAERGRKLGALTLHSIGEVSRFQRIKDNDLSPVEPLTMLSLLWEDERLLASSMRLAHSLCDQSGDVATASLLENWIDESERRSWFLDEITHRS